MEDSQLIYYVIVSGGCMLLFAIVLVSFFSFSQKKITNAKLALQEKELKFQEKLLQNTISVQEKERNRIARELHDEIASQLNIIHLNVHLLRQKTDRNDSEMLEIIEHISKSLKVSSTRTREISHELMPPLLQKFGLTTALEELIQAINMSNQLVVEFSGTEHIEIKAHLKILHIYRMVQELLNNTIKYAAASHVFISFEKKDNNLLFIYQDNGCGFDVANVKRGQGMYNIETRIRILHGILSIESQRSIKTSFNFLFPNND